MRLRSELAQGDDFMSVYESILKGLNEAIEYEKGNVQARTGEMHGKPCS